MGRRQHPVGLISEVHNHQSFTWGVCILAVCVLASTASLAQSAADAEATVQLETVTVTAEKREADLQLTPLSLTTYSGEQLREAGIDFPTELSLVTPGLVIGNSANTSIPELFIRGVGTTSIAAGSDLPIGYYFDDIYIARPEAMFLNFFDVERIEVLRGPQGTLYGRNTPGGAIKIISKKPSNEFETAGQLSLGNFRRLDVSQMVSGPIVEERLLGRLSLHMTNHEGYTRNLATDGRLADNDSYHLRGSLWYFISDNSDFLLTVDGGQDRAAGLAYKPNSVAPVFGGLAGPVTTATLGHVEPSDTYEVRHDTDSTEKRPYGGVSGKLTMEFDQYTFESISGFRAFRFIETTDVDGTSLQLFNLDFDFSQEQFTQEFKLASNDESADLEWLLGAYFLWEESSTEALANHQDVALLLGPADYSGLNDAEIVAQSYALYGQGRYKVTEQLSFTLGLRYSSESKDFDLRHVSNDPTGLIQPPSYNQNDSDRWDAFTPKAGVELRLSDDVMVYGSVSRGFKSGGYNALQLRQEGSFDPEFLTAYEAGIKSQWFDRLLQLNSSIFYYDYTDLQVQSQVPNGAGFQIITTNAAEAEIWGMEMEAVAIPGEGWEIIAGIAYLSAEYEEFINANGIDVSGNSLLLSPEFTSNIAVQYRMPIRQNDELICRVEHQYQSKIYFSETNEDVLAEDGFHNYNARIAYVSDGGKYSIALFGRNLSDEETQSIAFDFRPFLGSIIRNFNPPRTYGIELAYRF